jgi:CPA2 family monovalent cation:H+ antiporter-2
VLAAAAAVLLIKTVTTTLALLPLRVGWRAAAGTGLLLGQVGEFSFVLLTAGPPSASAQRRSVRTGRRCSSPRPSCS